MEDSPVKALQGPCFSRIRLAARYGVLLLLSLVFSWELSMAQDMAGIDKKMAEIPHSMTSSTPGISGWIRENFSSDRERVSAIFTWLARNISYDVQGMYNTTYYTSREESVAKTLATRKGVCQGYAAVFTELCQQLKIPAWTVSGYTRQFGQVVPLSHAWNAVILDNLVFLYDPTWGAGYVMNDIFTSRYNLEYFERTPEQMRPSHMPFDPLWQFSSYPISPRDFDEGKFEADPGSALFQYRDTLAQYVTLSPLEQSMARLRRIEQNGPTNELVRAETDYLRTEINIYRQNQVVNRMNAAVLNFNSGIDLFNQYIQFKNKQFQPARSDKALKLMIDTTKNSLLRAAELVHGLQSAEPGVNANIRDLEKSIRDSLKKVREEEAFVTKYLAAAPASRKKMFYQ